MNKGSNLKKGRKRLDPGLARLLALFAAVFLAAIALAVGIKIVQHRQEEESKEPISSAYPEQVYGVPVKTELMSPDILSRTGVKREIKYIVIHETDNVNEGANAERHSAYLTAGKSGETSWHYTVDDSEIYHHLPDDEIGWHAGDSDDPGGGNACGIGIELCVNADGDFEKTFENGAKLTAYLMKTYKLDITAVTQHADYMEKNCPSTIRDSGRWDEFLTLVEKYYNMPDILG